MLIKLLIRLKKHSINTLSSRDLANQLGEVKSIGFTVSGQKSVICRDLEITKSYGNPEIDDKFFRIWSGRWESNPRPKLGKLLYCHCTTPAHSSSLLIIHN
jgi:hypothetical protein